MNQQTVDILSRPYKMVWQTLITYCYKTSMDSVKKPLTLYHVWVIVWYFLNAIQLPKGITTINNGDNSGINKWIHEFSHGDYKESIDIKITNNFFEQNIWIQQFYNRYLEY